ncbi:VTT domain-containing protein [Saccharicrinis sp. 156]|uniref:VTT domain-containing protein n=1 Tax=Saccharicrinis sp. 156 TaxID=3417574 RepID=UPI003D350EEC
MEEIGRYFAVYLAGATGIWKGIPVGIAMGLTPFFTATFTSLGAVSSALLVYFSGEPFRKWLMDKYGSNSIAHKQEKFNNWLQKYGVAGLGLMVTGLLGPFISLMIGMLLLKDTRKFLLFLLLGILIWSFGITYLSTPIIGLVKGMM